MNPIPFRIEPTFSPRIWGARSLAPIYPNKTNLREPIGEAWLTDVNCRIANGPFAGKTLGDTWREMPVEWRGKGLANTNDFPILVKFLFPTDKLSIQVHPDDAYAAAHEKAAGGRGKTEAWHILSADPEAHVLLGFKPGITKEKYLAALSAGTVESLIEQLPVSQGDTIFVPARTVHAIGPGVIICEVQEYSDLTYRVFDYNRVDTEGRPRELHTEKALEVMGFGATSAGKVAPRPIGFGKPPLQHLVDCEYFSVDRWELAEPFHAKRLPHPPGEGLFEILVVLDGEATLAWSSPQQSSAEIRLTHGACWFVPSGTFHNLSVHPAPKVTLLWIALPASQKKRNLPM